MRNTLDKVFELMYNVGDRRERSKHNARKAAHTLVRGWTFPPISLFQGW